MGDIIRDSDLCYSHNDLENGSRHVIKCFNDMLELQYNTSEISLKENSVKYFKKKNELLSRHLTDSEKSSLSKEVGDIESKCYREIHVQGALRSVQSMLNTWSWLTIASIIREKK